ncbi:hypothetical protein [Paenibacillus marinisediminis]
MNMKPVELQIAVPRTTEASTIQQQQQQRPMNEQLMLNEQAVKQLRTQRQRSEQVDASAEGRIREHEQDSAHSHDSASQDQSLEGKDHKLPGTEAVPAAHPYKGKHIDYSV